MFRPGSTLKRWVIVTVAAYAMVLHALVMGAAHAVSGSAPEICPGFAGDAAPDAPSGLVHAAPCALCGLGHAAVDVPPIFALALPENIFETIERRGADDSAILPPKFPTSARPRAPPAFV